MNRKSQYVALLLVVAVAIISYAILKNKTSDIANNVVDDLSLNIGAWQITENKDVADTTGTVNKKNSETKVVKNSNSAVSSLAQHDVSTWAGYSNYNYGFSFRHPRDFRFTEFADGIGDMVLAQGEGNGRSFQIFITVWDEPQDVMTVDRIKRDIPDMSISDAQIATIKNGVKVLIFFSQDESVGELREVWMIHSGFLYQITAPTTLDVELSRIMSDWSFVE